MHTIKPNAPLIQIAGFNTIAVGPIATIADLSAVTVKFAKLAEAEPTATVCRLVTAIGDLSASVIDNNDTPEQFAEEVADVLIATMVAAANAGINADQIADALRTRLSEQSGKIVSDAVTNMLQNRGMTDLQTGQVS